MSKDFLSYQIGQDNNTSFCFSENVETPSFHILLEAISSLLKSNLVMATKI